jgi:ATP-dependent DNA helicase RecQ
LAPGELVDATADAKLAIEAIRATGSRFGAVHIVDVLMGAQNERVQRLGHEKLAVYGAGKRLKREEWQQLIRQLVAANFLMLDIAGYGGLQVGEQGRALLHGAAQFKHRPTVQPRRSERKTKSAAAAAVLTDAETTLLDALKQLRLRLAKQQRVAAYVIFSDKSLIDMAARKPQTPDEFAEVHGVGGAKLKAFAGVFLAAIARHQAGGSAIIGDVSDA